ncbi:MAG: Ger(x)C family spore germination C-terminal domain-containing protein, partial [Firmicutes bacterium]|nr:Ger(x)C family spore germination C-terminal domain-containing protein [Bacillota bacterium]
SQDRLDISGIAVFKDGKLKGFLEGDDAMAFLWVSEKTKAGVFTLKFPRDVVVGGEKIKNGEVTLWVVGVKSRPKVRREGGRFGFDIDLFITAQLLSATGVRFYPWRVELLKFVSRKAEEEVEAMARRMFKKLQEELKTDALSLGEFVRRKFPGEWDPRRWKEGFPEVEIRVQAHVDLKELTFIY